jgi:hypothetical protein
LAARLNAVPFPETDVGLAVDPAKQRIVQRVQFLPGSGFYFERVFSGFA